MKCGVSWSSPGDRSGAIKGDRAQVGWLAAGHSNSALGFGMSKGLSPSRDHTVLLPALPPPALPVPSSSSSHSSFSSSSLCSPPPSPIPFSHPSPPLSGPSSLSSSSLPAPHPPSPFPSPSQETFLPKEFPKAASSRTPYDPFIVLTSLKLSAASRVRVTQVKSTTPSLPHPHFLRARAAGPHGSFICPSARPGGSAQSQQCTWSP